MEILVDGKAVAVGDDRLLHNVFVALSGEAFRGEVREVAPKGFETHQDYLDEASKILKYPFKVGQVLERVVDGMVLARAQIGVAGSTWVAEW